MTDKEKIEKAIKYAQFHRQGIRNGLHKAATEVDMRTTAADMLTGIITILEGS